jgi:type VI secretion system protein ImpM
MYNSTFGYYGKLPVSSEFIRCQASGAEIDQLDQWIREGMYHAKSSLGPPWSQEFTQGDHWAFLYLPRDQSRFLIGLLKPSRDKAGREFPFLIYLVLEKQQFADTPWSAPMHFNEFFKQGQRLLSNIDTEVDLNRLQLRLQTLLPVDESGTASAEARYHEELRRRRMRDHWTDVFGEFDNPQKHEVLTSLLQSRLGPNLSTDEPWQAKFPLLLSCKHETYDLPFWIDLTSQASGHHLDTGILFWNRSPLKVKPLLLVTHERPASKLLLYLIHPEFFPQEGTGHEDVQSSFAQGACALLDDGEITLEAFLHRVAGLKAL